MNINHPPTTPRRIASDTAIGTNVLHLRGTTPQHTLAKQMRARGHSWSQATVWAVETGKRPLRLLEARDLAELLNATIDDLLTPPPADPLPPTHP